jgi:uncharacterized protein YneF (UPF0154 family)
MVILVGLFCLLAGAIIGYFFKKFINTQIKKLEKQND